MESERLLQVRIALRNCGEIDPGNIDDYIGRGGYRGLVRALKMVPEGVIEEVKRSGLRERGGNGSPVGEKWRLSFNAPGSEKVVICNAAEGDANSLTSRTLLEGDPHSVLEGMVIGAYATGAALGWIYINAEYGLAMSGLRTALKQAEDQRFLGDHIVDSIVMIWELFLQHTRDLSCFVLFAANAILPYVTGLHYGTVRFLCFFAVKKEVLTNVYIDSSQLCH